MWHYKKAANNPANITTPIYHQGKVFYTSAYDTGCALLDLKKNGDTIDATEAYFSKNMQNHHGGVVLLDGYLYGFSGNILHCLKWETGEVVWKDRSVGKGSLTYADGMLFLFGENNTVGLAEASSQGYKEKGHFTIEDRGRPSWAHPVVCGGKLLIRNQNDMYCFDVSGK